MLDALTISEALGGKRSGAGYLACCPAHIDRNPSLKISDGDNGKPLVHCKSGCTQEAVIAALARLGLWPEKDGFILSREELQAVKEKTAILIKKREAEELAGHESAACSARQIWDAAPPAGPGHHPYLAKKHIQAHGARKDGAKLLIPMRDDAGILWALQTIDSDGTKLFQKGGRVKGLYYSFGGRPEPGAPVCIAEGFATAAAIHEATGHPVAVAFSAHNLEPVVRTLKEKLPGHPLIIFADDDRKDDSDNNPGIEAATKAALAVGGWVAVPSMGKKADAWDLWNEQGPEAVREAIANARAIQDEQINIVASNQAAETTPAAVQEIGAGDPTTIIQHLATLSAVEYEQARKDAAAGLKMRATVLDKLVNDTRKGSSDSDLPFEETAPWPAPIDPAQLLSDIAATIQRFIVCSKDVSNTVALWSAMTWFMEVVQVAPLAVITAPEKRCGKSQLLSLLGRLSARSISASSISPAALYRAIDAWKPTLLIDEADAFMKDNEELRGIINSGHTRDSAYVIRTVGENFTPTKFNTWGAKAIAGIGHVADTLMDRAVILELRRKLPDEQVERVRYAEPSLFDDLRAKLARFSDDYSDQVRQARPYLPLSLNDRAQDNWEPLLAIAKVAGGGWLDIGTTAALKLSGGESAAQTVGTELLADIKEIFEMKKDIERISTADLIKELCSDDEKTWATYNRGFPVKPRQLATRLKGFGISSKTVRFNSIDTAKGYDKYQFNEAFARYLHPPDLSVTTSQPCSTGLLRVTDSFLVPSQADNVTDTSTVSDVTDRISCDFNVTDRMSSNSLFLGDCDVVTDRAPPPESGIVEVEI